MKGVKKLSVALLAMALSATALAATHNYKGSADYKGTAGHGMARSFKSGNYFAKFTWLYVKPMFSTYYGNDGDPYTPKTAAANSYDHYYVKSKNGNAWRIAFGHGYGRGFSDYYALTRMHITNHRTETSVDGLYARDYITGKYLKFDNGATINRSVRYKHYALDALIAHNTSVFRGLGVNSFVGLHAMDMDVQHEDRYSGIKNGFAASVDNVTKDKYWGLGPEVGVNAYYGLARGLKIVTGVAGALLVGEADSNYEYRTMNPAGTSYEKGDAGSTSHMVPYGTVKVGLSYKTVLRNWNVGVEAGYMGAKYWGVYRTGAVSGKKGIHSDWGDFDYSGPYLSVGLSAA